MKQPTEEQLTQFKQSSVHLAVTGGKIGLLAALKQDIAIIGYIRAVSKHMVLCADIILDIPAINSDNKNSSTSPLPDATGDPS